MKPGITTSHLVFCNNNLVEITALGDRLRTEKDLTVGSVMFMLTMASADALKGTTSTARTWNVLDDLFKPDGKYTLILNIETREVDVKTNH